MLLQMPTKKDYEDFQRIKVERKDDVTYLVKKYNERLVQQANEMEKLCWIKAEGCYVAGRVIDPLISRKITGILRKEGFKERYQVRKGKWPMCHFSFLMISEYSRLDRVKVESRIAKWMNEEVSFEVTGIFYRYHMDNWGEVVLICCLEISCPVIKEVRQDLDVVEN